ncbi:hypothetical protein GKE82_13390 [Conexibacter sp. W3-3-2]|uniref:VWD domain-containing protein n=1 Tax=Conexibacter sp. W3-3-2 TaxID=2675227 RepID=UPI0012B7591B|nr:VWD domain-containing protein [Conexibacter sp. W3-3-2]MTD45255.1 hypothetical protein [Conexibacter sp. W3-3-2]
MPSFRVVVLALLLVPVALPGAATAQVPALGAADLGGRAVPVPRAFAIDVLARRVDAADRRALRAARGTARASGTRLAGGRVVRTGTVVLSSAARARTLVRRWARGAQRIPGTGVFAALREGRGGSRAIHVGLVLRGRGIAVLRWVPSASTTAARRSASVRVLRALEARLDERLTPTLDGYLTAGRRADGALTPAGALRLVAATTGARIPGVPAPGGLVDAPASATAALRHALHHARAFTPAQRAAAGRALGIDLLTGTSASPAARRTAFRAPGSSSDVAAIEGFRARYAALLGRPPRLRLLVESEPGPPGGKAAAVTLAIDDVGKPSLSPTTCRIRTFESWLATKSAAYRTYSLAHEAFHCMQFELDGRLMGYSDWLIEGSANYAADRVTGLGSGGTPSSYLNYLRRPDYGLFERTYTAEGFWGRLDEIAPDSFFRVIDGAIRAWGTGGDARAYEAAGGTDPAFEDAWAPGLARSGVLTPLWFQRRPYVVADTQVRTPEQVLAATGVVTAKPLGNRLALVPRDPRVPLTEVRVLQGKGQVTNPPVDLTLRDQPAYFCQDGDCACPAGTSGTPPSSAKTPGDLRLAVGGARTGATVRVSRLTLEQFCDPATRPGGPSPAGQPGTAVVLGDPHLITFDGLLYSFQAVGEFVLARGAGGLEVQARFARVGRDASLMSMVAVRSGSATVVFDAPGEALRVRRDGTVLRAPTTVGDLSLTPDELGVTVRLPDGTRLLVTSARPGRLGIGFTPGPGRAGKLAGLLGDADGRPDDDLRTSRGTLPEALRQKARRGGTSLMDGAGPAFDDALYDVLGPSWRVTSATSILRYEPGESPASFVDRTVPRRPTRRPSPEEVRDAASVCARRGVDSVFARATCAADVARTNDPGWAADAAAAESAAESSAAAAPVRFAAVPGGADRRGAASVVAMAGGGLVAAWMQKPGGGPGEIVAQRLDAAAGTAGPLEPVAGAEAEPSLAVAPDGTPVATWATVDVPDRIPGFDAGTALSRAGTPGAPWAPPEIVTTDSLSGGETPSTVFTRDGTPLTVLPRGGAAHLARGVGRTDPGERVDPEGGSDCYASSVAVAIDAGAEAWTIGGRWDCPSPSLVAHRVDAATGTPVGPAIVPPGGADGYALGYDDAAGLRRLSLVARSGGGVLLGYRRSVPPTRHEVRVWRAGAPQATVVATVDGEAPIGVRVLPEPAGGRVWVAWEDGTGRLVVRRSEPDGVTFTVPARIVAPPVVTTRTGVSPWSGVAREGALDLVYAPEGRDGAPGGTWIGRLTTD